MQIRGRCSHRQTAGPRLKHQPRPHRRPTRLKRNRPAVLSRCTVPLYCPSPPPSVSLPSLVERKSHEAPQPKHLDPSAPLTCRGPMTQTHSSHPFPRKHSSKAIIREKKAARKHPSIRPTPSSSPTNAAASCKPLAAKPVAARKDKKKKKTPPGSAAIYTSTLSPASPSPSHTHDTCRRTVFQALGNRERWPLFPIRKRKNKKNFKKKTLFARLVGSRSPITIPYRAGPCPLACFLEDANGAVRESGSGPDL